MWEAAWATDLIQWSTSQLKLALCDWCAPEKYSRASLTGASFLQVKPEQWAHPHIAVQKQNNNNNNKPTKNKQTKTKNKNDSANHYTPDELLY